MFNINHRLLRLKYRPQKVIPRKTNQPVCKGFRVGILFPAFTAVERNCHVIITVQAQKNFCESAAEDMNPLGLKVILFNRKVLAVGICGNLFRKNIHDPIGSIQQISYQIIKLPGRDNGCCIPGQFLNLPDGGVKNMSILNQNAFFCTVEHMKAIAGRIHLCRPGKLCSVIGYELYSFSFVTR